MVTPASNNLLGDCTPRQIKVNMSNYDTLIEKFFGSIPDPEHPADATADAIELLNLCKYVHTAITTRCVYRTAQGRHDLAVNPSGRFFALAYRMDEMSVAMFGIGDPRVWMREVREPGMEVIDGRLVLAKIGADENGTNVILVEQGRGTSLATAVARVRNGGGAEWELVGKPDQRHPLLERFCTRQTRGREISDELWRMYLTISSTLSMRRHIKQRGSFFADGPVNKVDENDPITSGSADAEDSNGYIN